MPVSHALPLRARLSAMAAGMLGLAVCLTLLAGCTSAETATDTQGAQAPAARTLGASAATDLTEERTTSEPTVATGANGVEPAGRPAADRYPLKLTPATVTRVVDGDTAHVRLEDGAVEKVRFIGVNTPESTTRHEPFGEEASAYTKRKLPTGTQVWLETDAELRDRYGRLLAYVWLREPTDADTDDRATLKQASASMLNAWLVRDGFAQVMTIPPNVRYQDRFLYLEGQARRENRGLWRLGSEDEVGGEDASAAGAGVGSSTGAVDTGATGAIAYIGNRNSEKFHEPDCRWVREMSPKNRVLLESRDAAVAAGFVPCKVCRP